LGAPASAGGGSAFGPLKSKVDPTSKSYYDYWKAASPEDRRHASDELDKNLGTLGSGIVAKSNEMISNAMKGGDESTLAVAEQFGWSPTDKQKAFVGPPEDRKGSGWDREAMGGFLTELGFRILASNRQDLGGAFGEAAVSTMESRDRKKQTAAAQALAKSERERRHRREDEADQISRDKETRAKSKEGRDKLEKITLKNGEIIWADIEAGYAVDPDTGERIRSLTTADLSASSRRIAQDNLANAKKSLDVRLDKLIKEGEGGPEVDAIADEDDSKQRAKMREAWVARELERYDYAGSSLPEQIDYSSL
jgi:hypothetical protein